MTAQDLATYQAKERPAICGHYRVYTVCGMGPPSSGAITVLQILAMVERFDMAKLGKDNPESWHVIGEAMQLAYADRSEEHTSDLKSLMRISYAVLCLQNKTTQRQK